MRAMIIAMLLLGLAGEPHVWVECDLDADGVAEAYRASSYLLERIESGQVADSLNTGCVSLSCVDVQGTGRRDLVCTTGELTYRIPGTLRALPVLAHLAGRFEWSHVAHTRYKLQVQREFSAGVWANAFIGEASASEICGADLCSWAPPVAWTAGTYRARLVSLDPTMPHGPFVGFVR